MANVKPVETVRELIKALVAGINEEIRGYGSGQVPQINYQGVLTSMVRRAGKSRALLDELLTADMFSKAMEAVIGFALRERQTIIAVPEEDEISVGTLGMVIVSAVVASNTLGVTARRFMRRPRNFDYLRRLLVVAGMACLMHQDMPEPGLTRDDDEPSREELAAMAWDEIFGVIMRHEEMSLAYAEARVHVNQHGFGAFKESLRTAMAALEGNITPTTFRKMLAAAQHAATTHEVAQTKVVAGRWMTGGGNA